LGTDDDKENTITLTSWIKEIRTNLEKRGMDTVFHVIVRPLNGPAFEKYLLNEWGDISLEEVLLWLLELKNGVFGEDGERSPVCEFDMDNLIWSAEMIKNSITVKLWEEIESDLEYGATGPEIFMAVIKRFLHSSSSAARMLISKLQALRLVKEPGMNVDTFSKKVADLVQQIEGNHKRSVPEDLSTIVATCYLDTDVDEFKMEASGIFNQVDHNPKSMHWRQIIQQLKDKYRSLDGLNRWPHKGKKSHADEISALKGTINTLQQKVNGLNKSKGNQENGGGNERKCFNCGQTGHIKQNCPNSSNNGNSNNSGSDSNGSSQGSGNRQKHWRNTKPGDGQPHSKTVNGVEFIWCDKCNRWRAGNNKHTTANHKTKAELQASSNSGQGGQGGNQGGNGSGQTSGNTGGLRMMSSLFAGHVNITDSSLN
jgi:hypothetical protein